MNNEIEELRHVIDAIIIDNAIVKAEVKAVRGTLYRHLQQQSKEEYELADEQLVKVYKTLAIENLKGLKGLVYSESNRLKSIYELEHNL